MTNSYNYKCYFLWQPSYFFLLLNIFHNVQNRWQQEEWTVNYHEAKPDEPRTMDKRNVGTGNPAAQLLILLSHSSSLNCIATLCTNSCVFRYTDVSMRLQVCVGMHTRVCLSVCMLRGKSRTHLKKKKKNKMVFLVVGSQVLFLVSDWKLLTKINCYRK